MTNKRYRWARGFWWENSDSGGQEEAIAGDTGLAPAGGSTTIVFNLVVPDGEVKLIDELRLVASTAQGCSVTATVTVTCAAFTEINTTFDTICLGILNNYLCDLRHNPIPAVQTTVITFTFTNAGGADADVAAHVMYHHVRPPEERHEVPALIAESLQFRYDDDISYN